MPVQIRLAVPESNLFIYISIYREKSASYCIMDEKRKLYFICRQMILADPLPELRNGRTSDRLLLMARSLPANRPPKMQRHVWFAAR